MELHFYHDSRRVVETSLPTPHAGGVETSEDPDLFDEGDDDDGDEKPMDASDDVHDDSTFRAVLVLCACLRSWVQLLFSTAHPDDHREMPFGIYYNHCTSIEYFYSIRAGPESVLKQAHVLRKSR